MAFISSPPLPGSRASISLGVLQPIDERNVFQCPRWFAILVVLSLQSIRFRKVLVVPSSVELEVPPVVVGTVPALSSSYVPQPIRQVPDVLAVNANIAVSPPLSFSRTIIMGTRWLHGNRNVLLLVK